MADITQFPIAAQALDVARLMGCDISVTSSAALPAAPGAGVTRALALDTCRVWTWSGSAWADSGLSPLAAKVGGADGFRATTAVAHPQILDANGIELLGFNVQGEARFAVSQDVADQVARTIVSTYDPVAQGLISKPDILIVGDSMSTGTVRSALATQLGGNRTVTTLAKGGHTALSMSVVMGATPLTLTLTGNEIPASGGVIVVARSHNILSSGGTNAGTANVTIAGVAGALSTDSTGTWTFTRSAAGAVVAVPANSVATLSPTTGTPTIPATNSYRANTLVLRVGRNGNRGSRAERVALTLEPMRQIVDFLTPRVKRLVVVGPYNGRAQGYADGVDYEGAGTIGYTNMMTLIEEMRREFGPFFCDMRSAAVKNAAGDMGVSLTADDLADVSKDCLPRQFFNSNDNIHVNAAMQAWEGQFIGNFIRGMGL